MKTLPVTITLLLSVLTVAPLTAQEATETPDAGWPVEQRCVGDPTTPPNGWTFDGTIFLESERGVHAVRAGMETPYYVAFEGRDFTGAGSLSPDGRWFAVPSGHTDFATMVDDWYVIEEFSVYSTDPAGESYRVAHGALYRGGGRYAVSPVRWWDSTHIVIDKGDWTQPGIVMVDPFTGQEKSLESPFRLLHSALAIAPDWTTVAGYFEGKIGVFDFTSGTLKTELHVDRSDFLWRSDSTYFITELYERRNETLSMKLTLFDRDGKLIETVFYPPTDEYIAGLPGNNDLFEPVIAWSEDGDFLAFATVENASRKTMLYVANMTSQEIIDTCLSAESGVAFSPDRKRLAVANEGKIAILDLGSYEMHIVAYHDGSVIGWRAGE